MEFTHLYFGDKPTPLKIKTKFGNDIRVFKDSSSSLDETFKALRDFVAKSYTLEGSFLLQALDEDNVEYCIPPPLFLSSRVDACLRTFHLFLRYSVLRKTLRCTLRIPFHANTHNTGLGDYHRFGRLKRIFRGCQKRRESSKSPCRLPQRMYILICLFHNCVITRNPPLHSHTSHTLTSSYST